MLEKRKPERRDRTAAPRPAAGGRKRAFLGAIQKTGISVDQEIPGEIFSPFSQADRPVHRAGPLRDSGLHASRQMEQSHGRLEKPPTRAQTRLGIDPPERNLKRQLHLRKRPVASIHWAKSAFGLIFWGDSKIVRLFGLFRLFDCIGTSGDELVCRVVLVGGNQQSAAEAGTGFADCAAEGIFIQTTPAPRGEARRAFYHY